MTFKTQHTLSTIEKQRVFDLWNAEYPLALSYPSLEEFETYLATLHHPFHRIVLNESGDIKGWYFDFDRDGARWFGLILDRSLQGKGLGTKLLNLAKEKEHALHGWVVESNEYQKLDGTDYPSPLNFYLKNGFVKNPGVRLELEAISAVQIQWTKTTNL